MASVSGSKLSFFAPDTTQAVNVILTKDGSDVSSSDLVSGAFNIEVFTSVAGAALPGIDATALIEGAQTVSGGPSNEIQAKTLSSAEQLLFGNYWIVDHTGNESISAASIAGVSQSVAGSRGDTITAGSGKGSSLLVDASNVRGDVVVGPETIIGGGAQETVWASRGDSIVGGKGAITIAGNGTASPPGGTGAMTIIGGTGNLTAFDLGAGNSIVGSQSSSTVIGGTPAGFTFIDDSYPGGVNNTIIGGDGSANVIDPTGATMTVASGTVQGSFVKAGINDLIQGGGGPMLVDGHIGVNDTIQAGTAATTVWGGTLDSVGGGNSLLNFTDAGQSQNTVLGGSGGLFAFHLGTHDSIVGGSGGTIPGAVINPSDPSEVLSNQIDDSYADAQGHNTLVGGSAESWIIAGPNDSIIAGDGKFYANIRANLGAGSKETVDLSSSAQAVIRDDDSLGGTGTSATVNGPFDTSTDIIASATSVDSKGVFTGTSTALASGTLLSFNDGNTMLLTGVTDVTKIHFIQ